MAEGAPYQEMHRYVTELKELLAGPDLTADTRARCLASLIDAGTFEDAARTMRVASQELTGDAVPPFASAVRMFAARVDALGEALNGFREPAEDLAAQLRRMDGYR
jgi:hypothetical protein